MAILFLLIPVLGLTVSGSCMVYLWRSRRDEANNMNWRKRLAWIGAIASTLMLGWFLYINLGYILWARDAQRATNAKQVVLLYHTDHQAIRDAGQVILSDTNTYPNQYPDSEDLPDVIRNLNSSSVFIYPDRQSLMIEMGGGFFHYGFQIFAIGEAGVGIKELIPGMWYYSEDDKIITDR